jgi:hypothetical protein
MPRAGWFIRRGIYFVCGDLIMSQTVIEPIDSLVLAGFQQRFQQVFGCPCVYINQNDKTKILERVFGQGKDITYPYAWFTIQSLSPNYETYNAHPLGRRGITLNVASQTTINTVRIMPTVFDIEVNYVTNKAESVGQGSVLAFARRWLLARRFGYLKYTTKYGNMQFGIHVTLDEQVPFPQRENITEAETKYDVVLHAQIKGYTSEPVLGTQGKINKINLNTGIKLPNGQVISTTGGRVISTQTFNFD